MNILIIGSGLSGAIVARELASSGFDVKIIEKRNHIGGNAYDFFKDGILTHKYGPHIFHTNNEMVFNYISKFTKFNDFKNEVLGDINGKLVPIPFNFEGIDTFFKDEAEEIKEKLTKKYGLNARALISQLRADEDPQLSRVADFIYDNVFENYTTKMWGISASEIDPEVMKRVPIVIGYGTRYFSDKYEGLPLDGYTKMIENILDHKNIQVELNTNALDKLELKDGNTFFEGKPFNGPIVYTGPLEELFKHKFGDLSYRSLDIQFETLKVTKFQEAAVVNYPSHPEMTRISEYKNMTLQEKEGVSVISREYPGKYSSTDKRFNEQYYPMMSSEAASAYKNYADELAKYSNVYPLGRLATFKYINMDQAIALALELANKIKGDK